MKEMIKDLEALISKLTEIKSMEPIDRDLLMEKIRKAYDIVSQTPVNQYNTELHKMEEPLPQTQQEETVPHAEPEPAEEQPEKVISENETVSEKRAAEFSSAVNVSEPATLFDFSQEEGKPMSSVHEQISDKAEDVSVEQKLKKHPVTDLKKSIGINEKFSLINELFDGDLQTYNSTIDQLNNCQSFVTASDLLKATAEKLSWEEDSSTVKMLTDLVGRRFNS